MTYGSYMGWHEVAEREVRKLGAPLARHTGQEKSEAIGQLWLLSWLKQCSVRLTLSVALTTSA